LGASLHEPARNRHAAYYADKPMESFPRGPAHPWLAGNKRALNDVAAMRRYAAEVSGVDDGVGRVLDALAAHGLEENTIVVFTADQGLAGGHNGFWGMGDHTRPLTAYDWTMHTPLIYRHPGKIAAGSKSDLLVSNYDFLPTLLEHLELADKTPAASQSRERKRPESPAPPGLADKTPAKPPLPGRSYAAALAGRPLEWEDVMFFEFETVRAVRTPEWKYITRFPNGPDELYDLRQDPGETRNLVDQAATAQTQAGLKKRLDAFFARYADPRFDLTRGGTSKAPRRSGKNPPGARP
jgi:arylsulfatase A-like enzyme